MAPWRFWAIHFFVVENKVQDACFALHGTRNSQVNGKGSYLSYLSYLSPRDEKKKKGGVVRCKDHGGGGLFISVFPAWSFFFLSVSQTSRKSVSFLQVCRTAPSLFECFAESVVLTRRADESLFFSPSSALLSRLACRSLRFVTGLWQGKHCLRRLPSRLETLAPSAAPARTEEIQRRRGPRMDK